MFSSNKPYFLFNDNYNTTTTTITTTTTTAAAANNNNNNNNSDISYIRQVLLIIPRADHMARVSILKYQRIVFVSFSRTDSSLWI